MQRGTVDEEGTVKHRSAGWLVAEFGIAFVAGVVGAMVATSDGDVARPGCPHPLGTPARADRPPRAGRTGPADLVPHAVRWTAEEKEEP